jgi:hypothetical protein
MNLCRTDNERFLEHESCIDQLNTRTGIGGNEGDAKLRGKPQPARFEEEIIFIAR